MGIICKGSLYVLQGSGNYRVTAKTPYRKNVSPADPETGILKRPGKPMGQHYLSYQSIGP